MEYLPRTVDGHLLRLITDLPAVAIDGPRAVGKSTTGGRVAASVVNLDQEDDWEMVAADPARLERLPKPLLVDEWQLMPSVWDRVRRAVDAGAGAGSYVLTGSSSPVERPRHTGAGRIVRVRMRPMSLAERRITSPTVSLGALLGGDRPAVEGDSPVSLDQYAEEITATGFPGIRAAPGRSRADLLDGYLADIIDRDFPEAGHRVRRPTALRRWLRAFAAATSTCATYAAILDASTPGDTDKPTKATTTAYRDTLERMWLLDEVPAWGGRNHMTALAKAPKHHLADPGLAARLLGVNAAALLDQPHPDRPVLPREGLLVGALFEGLATLCVQVYAQANRARVSHLRTAKGTREIDLVVERDDGRVVPVEVKLTHTVRSSDVAHLLWLRETMPDDVLDMVVLTTGRAAYRRPDGVAVVPLALLGP